MAETKLANQMSVRFRCKGDHPAHEAFPYDQDSVFDDREWTIGPWLNRLYVVWYDPKEEPKKPPAPSAEADELPTAAPIPDRHVQMGITDADGFLLWHFIDSTLNERATWPVDATLKVYFVRAPSWKWAHDNVVRKLERWEEVPGGIDFKEGACSDGRAGISLASAPTHVFTKGLYNDPAPVREDPPKSKPPKPREAKDAGKDVKSIIIELDEDPKLFLCEGSPIYKGWVLYRGMPHSQCKPVQQQVRKLQYHLGQLRYIVGCQNHPYTPTEFVRKGVSEYWTGEWTNAAQFDVLVWGAILAFQEDARCDAALALAPAGDTPMSGPPSYFTGATLEPTDAVGGSALLDGDPSAADKFIVADAKHSMKFLNTSPADPTDAAKLAPLPKADGGGAAGDADDDDDELAMLGPDRRRCPMDQAVPAAVDKPTAAAIAEWLSKRYRKDEHVLVNWRGSSAYWCNEIIAPTVIEWDRRLRAAGFKGGVSVNHSFRDVRLDGLRQRMGGGAIGKSAHNLGLAFDLQMIAFLKHAAGYPICYSIRSTGGPPTAANPRPGLTYGWDVWGQLPAASKNDSYPTTVAIPGDGKHPLYTTEIHNAFATVAGDGAPAQVGYDGMSVDAGKGIQSYSVAGSVFVSFTALAYSLNQPWPDSVDPPKFALHPIGAHEFGAQGGAAQEECSVSDSPALSGMINLEKLLRRLDIHARQGGIKSGFTIKDVLVDAADLQRDYDAWDAWVKLVGRYVLSAKMDAKMVKALGATRKLSGCQIAFDGATEHWSASAIAKRGAGMGKSDMVAVALIPPVLVPGTAVVCPEIKGTPSHLEWWHFQGGFADGVDNWLARLSELGVRDFLALSRDYWIDDEGFGGVGRPFKSVAGPVY